MNGTANVLCIFLHKDHHRKMLYVLNLNLLHHRSLMPEGMSVSETVWMPRGFSEL